MLRELPPYTHQVRCECGAPNCKGSLN